MRLAIVRQSYNPFGGAERFVERALSALSDIELDVTLIARRWRGERGDKTWLRCDPSYIGRLMRDWGFAGAVQSLIREKRFDLVQSHERIPGCDIFRAGDGVHATWLELRAATLDPLARIAQGLSPWHRYTLAAEAAMFRHPNLRAVICNSKMVAGDIARRFKVSADRLHVIYNGVDLDHFHPGLRQAHRSEVRRQLGVEEDAPVVLMVGSGFARKGVWALLDAFSAHAHPAAQLWVVGADKNQARCQARAQALGIGSRTRFLGGQRDVQPFYGAADVFALPTLYDPFPNAALEALACGLPLITSTTCGAAELVVDGKNGFVCEARDVASLGTNLVRACTSAEAMRDAARDSVAHLSLQAMALQLQALYRQLLTASKQCCLHRGSH